MDEKKKILEMISEGKISPEEGMKYYILCPMGTFSENVGADKCQECPKGTYGNETGQIEPLCNGCPKGIVCLSSGLKITDFLKFDNLLWKFCPSGYNCPKGTTDSNMTDSKCEAGFFCMS